MKIRNFEDLNLQEVDTMREISSIGTSHAATALSKFLQKEIRITLPQVSILGYEDAVDRIGNIEEVVAATLVKMDGDVDGLMLFLFGAGGSGKHHYLLLYQCFFTAGGHEHPSVRSQLHGKHAGRHTDSAHCRIRL